MGENIKDEIVLDNKNVNLQEIKERRLILESKPTHIWLAVSGKCNLSCAHCLGIPGRGSTRKSDLIDLDWKIFEQLERDLFPYVETCVLGGNNRGEPFFAKDWDRYCDRLLRFPMKIEVTTNGTLLSNERIEKLVSHGVDLRISVDGATEETLRLIRGVRLSKIVESIAKINETRETDAHRKTKISLNFAICYSNVRELPELIEMGSGMGVDEICVMHLMPQIESQRYQSLFYHMDTYNHIAEKARLIAEEKGIRLDMAPPFDCGQIIPTNPVERVKGEKVAKNDYCLLPWNSVSITNKGTVEPCCVGAMREMGDLNKKSFDEIWNGRRYRKLRKEMVNQKQTRGCKNCPFRFFERDTENIGAAILSDIGPATSYPVGILLRKWGKDFILKSPYGSRVIHYLIDYYRKL
ncbi:MAG: SPASM domain-containing protein [Thermoplasmata archaeon]|nr:MAG: SPASM domain-containing protein [Thermoplasmata archaeon]